MSHSTLRNLPSVDWVLSQVDAGDLPRPTVVAVVRQVLESVRSEGQVPEKNQILESIQTTLTSLEQQRIRPVINATGVLIHTNLGRAPLGQNVVKAVSAAASQYSNVEIDLVSGKRCSRSGYLKHNLALLCKSESATVVNNNASALMLVLHHFCNTSRNEVVVSRGELVQIGGGFRIPDILEASGAKLREVGTTNHTLLEDYQRALSPQTALVLRVHRSNFFMAGFVESPRTSELVAICNEHQVPLVEDLGSGAVVATERLHASLQHEPTIAEVVKQGVDLVTFSGDKVLGGPQAGIIAGKKAYIEALEFDPFYRGLRCGKLILVALQAVVDSYLRQEEETKGSIPIVSMLTTPLEDLRQRAEVIVNALDTSKIQASVTDGKSCVGGGSLPSSTLPSVVVSLSASKMDLETLAARLRTGSPSLVGYVNSGRLCLDLRTVLPAQDKLLIEAINAACNCSES